MSHESVTVAGMNVDAVIVAAGSSSRFGDEDKLLVDLCGRPLLAWAVAAFEAAPCVQRIVVVAAADRLAAVTAVARAAAPTKLHAVIAGGARRRDSVEAGLCACTASYVAIHDGARPLVTPALIERTVAAATGLGGAIAAVPVTDTVKVVQSSRVIGHPERSTLRAAQTPQVVRRQAWLDASATSDNNETDDAAMLARLALDVAVVEGDPENIKVTRPADLEAARAILRARGGA